MTKSAILTDKLKRKFVDIFNVVIEAK
jgi:hypothetical protein